LSKASLDQLTELWVTGKEQDVHTAQARSLSTVVYTLAARFGVTSNFLNPPGLKAGCVPNYSMSGSVIAGGTAGYNWHFRCQSSMGECRSDGLARLRLGVGARAVCPSFGS
jgi:hypothetical protein